MSSLKPIILHSHVGGPNPWKVAIFLEELNLPYEHKFLDFGKGEHKQKPFTDINPNGRVPAIEDPNTGFSLWESGAILEYLQETYDKSNQFNASGFDKFKVKQWLHFQVSGQGPYYGQAMWFSKFHPEKLESAIKRYSNETLRVLSVLNDQLQGKTWLVGEKYTIADLAFVPWNRALPVILGDEYADVEKKFPAFFAWNQRVLQRPAVAKVLADQDAEKAKH